MTDTMEQGEGCGEKFISLDDAFDLAQTLRAGAFQNGDAQGAVTHRFANLVIARHERMRSAAPELYEALWKLANECDGLRAFEDEIRDAIGNTNWNVLRLRVDEARAALLKASGGKVAQQEAKEGTPSTNSDEGGR